MKKFITILDEFVESSTEKDVVFVASYINELLSTNFKLEDYYEKIDAVLNVYGLNAIKNDLSLNFKNEEICAWAIENISKEELLK